MTLFSPHTNFWPVVAFLLGALAVLLILIARAL